MLSYNVDDKPMNEAVLMQSLKSGRHVTAEVQQQSLTVQPLHARLLAV